MRVRYLEKEIRIKKIEQEKLLEAVGYNNEKKITCPTCKKRIDLTEKELEDIGECLNCEHIKGDNSEEKI